MNTEESKYKNKVRDLVQIDSDLISDIAHLIDDKADQSLKNIILGLHPADLAEIINHLSFDDGVYFFRLLDSETAADVVTELDEDLREKLVNEVNLDELIQIIDELETDDATDIVSDLPEIVQKQVLGSIDKEDSEDVKELLKYDEETAGGLMSADFLFVRDSDTVNDAIAEIRKNSEEFEHIYKIYVLDKNETLLGSVSLKNLLINAPDTSIIQVMEEDLIYVLPTVDQEEVANIMQKYDLVALPVVDENKKMLGRITIDDVMDVMEDEASEDMQKMAGLSDEQESGHSVFTISRIRLPWLIISLFMELLNALLMSQHQALIEQFVVATFFIPIIMAMGGSSGQQAAIVTVRGLISGDMRLQSTYKTLLKEFGVAFLNGIILGTILIITTQFFWTGVRLDLSFSVVLTITLLSVIIIATLVGAIIPLILNYFKIDPAIATGPFVSTTNDIVGMLIYFSIISVYLSF